MQEKWILGIRVNNREENSRKIQYTLSKFGCSIRTRLGINEDDQPGGSEYSLILLELTGDPSEFPKLMEELSKINGISVEKMVFLRPG